MKRTNQDIASEIVDKSLAWRGIRRSDPMMQLRRLMRDKNIKSIDLAERLGVSEANVSRWLGGTQNLRLDTLYALADAVEEPLTIVFGNISFQYETDPSSWNQELGCEDIWEGAGQSNIVDFTRYQKVRATPAARTDKPTYGETGESLAAFA